MFRTFFITIILLVAFKQTTTGQQIKNDDLFNTIFKLDSACFKAFNEKNFELFKNYFDSTLEFYHDHSGLTDYKQNMIIFQENFAKGGDLTRTLLKETMEVYPVPGFGAVQIARHRFCHTENGKPDCGVFKFIHLWKKTDSGWKITRIISVDH